MVLAFDLTSKASFQNVNNWIEQVNSNTNNVDMILVGNKSDMVDQRAVSKEDVSELASKY